MGVDKSQTRERRGTDDHGSNDRAVLTGEQTAAIDDASSNAEPGVAPMTDQPGPSALLPAIEKLNRGKDLSNRERRQ